MVGKAKSLTTGEVWACHVTDMSAVADRPCSSFQWASSVDAGAPEVFEPRRKQMLDDCVLGGEPFGYVASADPPKALGGWALPGQYGLLADAEDVSEQGTNLLFTASGETRFKISRVLPAALPARDFGEIFPTVDELVGEYVDEDPDGKLYLRAEVEELPPLEGKVEHRGWEIPVSLERAHSSGRLPGDGFRHGA